MTWESCGSQRARGKRRAVHCSGYRRRLTRLCPTELEFECKDLPGKIRAGHACSRPALRRTARASRCVLIVARVTKQELLSRIRNASCRKDDEDLQDEEE